MRRLLIVDDEPEVVEGLLAILSELPDVLLRTANLASAALDALNLEPVDVVLADIHMPGMDGLTMCEQISRRWPDTRIIFLSGARDFNAIYRSIQNPTVRYLDKMEPASKIQRTVEQVFQEIEEKRRQQRLHSALPQVMLDQLSREPERQDAIPHLQAYIQANLDKDLSLSALGRHMGFNPNYLSRLFKEQTGVALSDYVLQLRMATAAQMLTSTRDKVHVVAQRVGYDSTHSFTRAFQRAYDMTPAEWRTKNTL